MYIIQGGNIMNIINSSFYNIISILLGLLSIVFAVYNIITVSKKGIRHNSWLSTLSVVMCVCSLYFQILWTGHLLNNNDLTTLVSSHSLTRIATTILIIVVFTLNVVGFILAKTNKEVPVYTNEPVQHYEQASVTTPEIVEAEFVDKDENL